MKISELARRTGFSAHTLRYYEQIGLLPKISKDTSGQRNYELSALVWLGFVRKLRETGMPIREMVRYAELRNLGDGTASERKMILMAHRQEVQLQIELLQTHLLAIDEKVAFYTAKYPDIEENTNDQTSARRSL